MKLNLTTSRIKLLARLCNRVKRGTVTTHQEWFEFQCQELKLDMDKTMTWLLNSGIVRRSTRKYLYPVIITIYKDD